MECALFVTNGSDIYYMYIMNRVQYVCKGIYIGYTRGGSRAPAARSDNIDLPTANNGQFSPLKIGVAGCNSDAPADTSGTGVLLA